MDILLLSPCCSSEEFTEISGDKCQECEGKGKVYIQSINIKGNIDIKPCDLCQGKGIIASDTYICFHCGTHFKSNQIIKEDLVYQNE